MPQSQTYVIGQRDNGEPCCLSMNEENAVALGLAAEFPTYKEWNVAEMEAGRRKGYFSRRSRICGGRVYALCRTPSRAGTPKGLYHQFRLSRNVKNILIAETLQKIKLDWYWVALPGGMRRPKEDWLAMIPPSP